MQGLQELKCWNACFHASENSNRFILQDDTDPIVPAELSKLTALTRLTVDHDNIDGNDPSWIYQLKELRVAIYKFQGTSQYGRGLSALQKLQHLTFDMITPDHSKEQLLMLDVDWSALKHLQSLTISNGLLSADRQLLHWAALDNFENFSLNAVQAGNFNTTSCLCILMCQLHHCSSIQKIAIDDHEIQFGQNN